MYDSLPQGTDGESRRKYADEVKKQTPRDKKVLFGVKSGGFASVRVYWAYSDGNSILGDLHTLYFPDLQQQQPQPQQKKKSK